ncbi:hypothetical protein ACIBK8_28420 [Streptomyces sp. NPDC050161]|uniref:hypothetical protein n=1 Tax=Streptomyces sp. NPDC050161 TaxID=3365604 RepID=UPI00378F809D
MAQAVHGLGLAELARALQPTLAGLPEDALVERVLQWFVVHEGWLIVLDNVDRLDDIRSLLDRIPSGRLLITTRRSTGWHHTATTLHLDVERTERCRKRVPCLRSHCKRSVRTWAGRHVLAIQARRVRGVSP